MKTTSNLVNRRSFIGSAVTIAAGTFSSGLLPQATYADEITTKQGLFMIGPMKGYTPQIGTLVSMLNYNRSTIIKAIQSLSQAQLDYLYDPKANTIGSLVLHLAAVEKYYQINTFEGREEFNEEEKKAWNAALNLGDEGREEIKGHNVKYYLNILSTIRQTTLEQLKKKDDEWLLAIDPASADQENVNTYWKWFHVCEHESNHRGQIAWIKSRLPKIS